MFGITFIFKNTRVFKRDLNIITITMSQPTGNRFYSQNTQAQGYKNIEVGMVDAITTIGINRPAKRNCVNLDTAKELMEAFKNFEKDQSSPVAVFYGTGGTFCAGFDLNTLAEKPAEIDFESSKHFDPTNSEKCGPMGPSRRFIEKPIIAAVDGYAVAGGLELATMCDMRVMEEDAITGVFCRRFGVPLLDGGTVRLPHLIGLSRAMDLILTGRGIGAKEALSFGWANRVVKKGEAFSQAIELAKEISKFPQECLRRDRESAFYAMYDAKSFQDAIEYELRNGVSVVENESVKGAQNFVGGTGRHGSFNLQTKSKL